MADTPGIEKNLVVSTGHLSKETMAQLEMKPCPLSCCKLDWDYGWLVWVYDEADVAEHQIPSDLAQLMPLARKLGCTWIRFDADASTVDGYEVFDHTEHPLVAAVRRVRAYQATPEEGHDL